VGEGSSIALEVDIDGVGPFSYQWMQNDTSILSSVERTLDLDNLDGSDAGDYSVIVDNGKTSEAVLIATVSIEILPPDEDLDKDGITNIVESAFGMDSTLSDSELIPRFSFSENTAEVEFEALRDDLLYVISSSQDLIEWVIEESIEGGGGLQRSILNYNSDASRFFKLQVNTVE
tara:strand:- start:1302 stop:1826 length:525 start_codon:yes stop_codon:yes gene_type:complete